MYKLHLSFIFVGCLSLLICCTKNSESKLGNQSKAPSKADIIQHAKEWYEQHHSGINGARSTIAENPDWAAAQATFINDIQVASVPTYINMVTGTVKQQIILTDANGFTSSRIVEIIPDVTYYSNTAFTSRYRNFTGTVKVYMSNNVLRNSLSYTNGLKSGSVVSRTVQPTLASSVMEGIELNEVEIIAPSLSSQSGYIIVNLTPSIINNPTIVPVSMYPSSWGSGTAPGSYVVQDLGNHLKDPCLSTTLNTLLNGNCKTWLMQLINDMFGAGGNFNINFEEKTALQMPAVNYMGFMDPASSSFNGEPNGPNRSGNITVYLNADSLKGASKELQAAVILHESIHAIFFARGLNALTQHDLMAESYRDKISESLQEYFPNLSATDAAALSWEGLQFTYDWNMASLRGTPSLSNIVNTISKYQKAAVGTPCPH